MYKTLGFEECPEVSHDDLIGIRLGSADQDNVNARVL
jgi:hypothetical protein